MWLGAAYQTIVVQLTSLFSSGRWNSLNIGQAFTQTRSVQIVKESVKQVAEYTPMQCSAAAYIDAKIGIDKVCRFTDYDNK